MILPDDFIVDHRVERARITDWMGRANPERVLSTRLSQSTDSWTNDGVGRSDRSETCTRVVF